MEKNINNYSSDPKIWGPFFWYVLKSTAYNYPEKPDNETITHTRETYLGMQSAIPCADCRTHYKKYLAENSIEPYLKNRSLLINWVNNLELAIKNEKKKVYTPPPIIKSNISNNDMLAKTARYIKKIAAQKVIKKPVIKKPVNDKKPACKQCSMRGKTKK